MKPRFKTVARRSFELRLGTKRLGHLGWESSTDGYYFCGYIGTGLPRFTVYTRNIRVAKTWVKAMIRGMKT